MKKKTTGSYMHPKTTWNNTHEIDPDADYVNRLGKDSANKNPMVPWFSGSTGCTYAGGIRTIHFPPMKGDYEANRRIQNDEGDVSDLQGEGRVQ
jgi:hypothetical protein